MEKRGTEVKRTMKLDWRFFFNFMHKQQQQPCSCATISNKSRTTFSQNLSFNTICCQQADVIRHYSQNKPLNMVSTVLYWVWRAQFKFALILDFFSATTIKR